jgi:hypothetical protein
MKPKSVLGLACRARRSLPGCTADLGVVLMSTTTEHLAEGFSDNVEETALPLL